MERSASNRMAPPKAGVQGKAAASTGAKGTGRRPKKMSEYGKQLAEKQRVKHIYGVREKQFRRFFANAVRMVGAPGHNLLSLLERRLDNVVYRLKFATSRAQARQIVVHGHIYLNGKKAHTPSMLVKADDVISLRPKDLEKGEFLEQVIDKRLNLNIKIPEWLELDKEKRMGRVLRNPVRTDITAPIEEYLIVEIYSK